MKDSSSILNSFGRQAARALLVGAAVATAANAVEARDRHVRDDRGSRGPYASYGSAFDGPWSVEIRTDSGPCDRGYRYRVDVVQGQVTYEGQPYGRVAPNGAVRVRMALGDQQAEGVGRLSRSGGSGVWQGVGHSGVCAGRWFAERRPGDRD